MRFIAILIFCLLPMAVLAELLDIEASEEIRGLITMLRDSFVVEEYTDGLRGRDIYLEAPRTLVYEYELDYALSDPLLTLEDMKQVLSGYESQLESTWSTDPAFKYWSVNDLHQTWLYRDASGLKILQINSSGFRC